MTAQKTILITGCSTGIGAFCARKLHSDGWKVFATARTEADLVGLRAAGLEAHYLDYREPNSIAELADAVLAATDGKLDALFNNGAYGQAGGVEDLPMEALREQFETNVFGVHDLTTRLIPAMRKAGSGRIVNCSSILGLVPMPWRGAYNASKFALEGLSITLRQELEGSGIFVSLIEPGPIDTNFTANALKYIHKYIDIEGSIHSEEYQKQIKRLEQKGRKSKYRLGPDAVYAVLHKALTDTRPQPHYLVTTPAKTGVLLKRLLPADRLYQFLARRA